MGLDYLIIRLNPRICLREQKPSTYLLNEENYVNCPRKANSGVLLNLEKLLRLQKRGARLI